MKFTLLNIIIALAYLVNWVQDVHTEGTFVVVFLLFGPFLGLRIEEILSPKSVTSKYLHRYNSNAD